mgnify:CR=1 FL=1
MSTLPELVTNPGMPRFPQGPRRPRPELAYENAYQNAFDNESGGYS